MVFRTDENPPSNNDSGDPANDSGVSENGEEKSDDTEEKGESLPDGPTLSLRLPAFDSIFDTADETLRGMAVALKTKLIESGELVIKVTLNNYGGILKPDPKKCNVACNLKPAKVSTPIRFPSDLEITVEKDGRVIIPEDREHQHFALARRTRIPPKAARSRLTVRQGLRNITKATGKTSRTATIIRLRIPKNRSRNRQKAVPEIPTLRATQTHRRISRRIPTVRI